VEKIRKNQKLNGYGEKRSIEQRFIVKEQERRETACADGAP
jgi:hypothetical protein